MLDRLLVSKPLIGIQIPIIEQQNSLLKLAEAAGELNLPLRVWSGHWSVKEGGMKSRAESRVHG